MKALKVTLIAVIGFLGLVAGVSLIVIGVAVGLDMRQVADVAVRIMFSSVFAIIGIMVLSLIATVCVYLADEFGG